MYGVYVWDACMMRAWYGGVLCACGRVSTVCGMSGVEGGYGCICVVCVVCVC